MIYRGVTSLSVQYHMKLRRWGNKRGHVNRDIYLTVGFLG